MKRSRNSVMLLWASQLLTILCMTTGLQADFLGSSRRQFVATVLTTAAGTTVVKTPERSISELVKGGDDGDSLSLSLKLLSIIPVMDSGAPATNATFPRDVWLTIEDFVSIMEESSSTNKIKNAAQSPLLSGSWRLLYSNAPEIVGLAKGLPLGFYLGPTYQPLDTSKGFFENTARLDHPYQLATLKTIVVGNIEASPMGSLNAVGIVNDKNNRVTVNFEAIVFEVDSVLGRPLQTPIRKTLVPRKAIREEGTTPLPANDQTYLDERVRIVRGGDGSLFVFSREDENFTPLSLEERASITLIGTDREQKKGKTSKEIPAEIKYLFREQK